MPWTWRGVVQSHRDTYVVLSIQIRCRETTNCSPSMCMARIDDKWDDKWRAGLGYDQSIPSQRLLSTLTSQFLLQKLHSVMSSRFPTWVEQHRLFILGDTARGREVPTPCWQFYFPCPKAYLVVEVTSNHVLVPPWSCLDTVRHGNPETRLRDLRTKHIQQCRLLGFLSLGTQTRS